MKINEKVFPNNLKKYSVKKLREVKILREVSATKMLPNKTRVVTLNFSFNNTFSIS